HGNRWTAAGISMASARAGARLPRDPGELDQVAVAVVGAEAITPDPLEGEPARLEEPQRAVVSLDHEDLEPHQATPARLGHHRLDRAAPDPPPPPGRVEVDEDRGRVPEPARRVGRDQTDRAREEAVDTDRPPDGVPQALDILEEVERPLER